MRLSCELSRSFKLGLSARFVCIQVFFIVRPGEAAHPVSSESVFSSIFSGYFCEKWKKYNGHGMRRIIGAVKGNYEEMIF